jgi:hypothetical protein
MAPYPTTAWTGALGNHATSAGAATGRAKLAGITVHEAIADFLEAAEGGSARDRYGRTFSDESVRELRWCLAGHVDDRLGAMDLSEVRRRDIEALVYELASAGLSRRRVRAVAKSLRALYDFAGERDLEGHNPAERIALPDEDDAEQPTRGRPKDGRRDAFSLGAEVTRIGADRALSLALRAATLCFVLLALFFIAESL